MAELIRTHNIEQIIAAPIGTPATLMGWVHYRRDFGGLIFITLRDRWGELQCVFDPAGAPAAHAIAQGLRSECVVAFSGETRPRPEKEVRSYPGGDREFVVGQAAVLSMAEPAPFVVEEDVKAGEEIRLKYRYLDLRRRAMVRMLTIRHKAVAAIRGYLDSQGFLEIETPLLARTTPEGARDYVVPSRVHPGKFYALPQSPQLYKQILMCGGVDRYYQIAKCLRDEDLRGNRQPEHTQLDLEMSFASRDELFSVIEGAMAAVWRDCLGEELPVPFPRLSYDDAMARFGSDKPDLRFGAEIRDLTPHFAECSAEFIQNGLAEGQSVHGVFIPQASLSRKQLDEWTAEARSLGAGGLLTLELGGAELRGTLAKHITDPTPFASAGSGGVPAADSHGGQGHRPAPPSESAAGTWFMLLGPAAKNTAQLGQFRLKLGEAFSLIDKQRWEWTWVVDFPLYERDATTHEVAPAHHAFTHPLPEHLDKLLSDDPQVLLSIRADNYDLVLNGVEMCSGSLRIFDPALQRQVLRKVGMSDAQIEARFGWFLEAYRYGAPPHRGVGYGIDRLVMRILGLDNIREVIAFPKTATAVCPLTGAPAEIEDEQWRELGIRPAK
jgi:aspartyl-tRNA synthetase